MRHVPTQKDKNAPLLPPISQARELARWIGGAVAKQAMKAGLSPLTSDAELERKLEETIWEPVYVPYTRKS